MPLKLFEDLSWDQYVAKMYAYGTHGDEITLRTVSNLLISFIKF